MRQSWCIKISLIFSNLRKPNNNSIAMVFTTLINDAVIPPLVARLEEEYMCPTTRHKNFSVDIGAVNFLQQDDFLGKLCSAATFLSMVWSFVDPRSTGTFPVYSRVIQNELPYDEVIKARLKPVPIEVLAAIVWETDPSNKSLEEFPLGRGVNVINHVLFPLDEKVLPGVCSLTRQTNGKMSFMSPLNQRPKSFPPGTFLVFTA